MIQALKTMPLLACGAALALVLAATPATAQRRAFDVPAQPATRSIPEFARQAGIQIIAPGSRLRGLRTPQIRGTFDVREALARLLRGTGLSIVEDQGATITLGAAGTGEGEAGGAAADDAGAETVGIAEILVVGTRSQNADIRRSRDDPQPYVVFDRTTIENSGAQTVQDFLRTRLTSNAVGSSPSQSTSGNNRSLVNLRGLGQEQTLILVDGRRIASANQAGAAVQPDINGIPLAAIERIDVLPATASGAYGGAATGGVVNVILRRDYSGAEIRITHGDTFDGGGSSRRIDFATGLNLEGGRTNILLSGSYSDSSDLLAGDRDYLREGRRRVAVNAPATFLGTTPPLGATTNIRSANGQILTLKPQFGGGSIGSSFTSVPYGYAGPASDNGVGLIANAGRYNLDPAATAQSGAGLNQSLFNSPTIKSVRFTLRREFGARIRGFLDFSHSENRGEFAVNNVSGFFSLPATAAGNPFDQNIVVVTPALGVDQRSVTDSNDTRVAGGVIVSLPADWRAELDYTWNRSRSAFTTAPTSLTASASNAVNSGALNLFTNLAAAPTDFSPYLGFATNLSPATTTMNDVALRVGGPLPLRLPGGSASLTTLLEHRRERLGAYLVTSSPTSATLQYPRSQRINSTYGELTLPLIAPANRVPAIHRLQVNVNARYDDYRLVGANSASFNPATPPTSPPVIAERPFSSFNYTVAARYEPAADIAIRASYGTGFLPPSLNQLAPNAPLTLDRSAFGLLDPRRGNELIRVVTFQFGGNADLKPENSRSMSAGIILEPRFVPGLRASADWIRITKVNNVTSFGLDQATINNELLLPGIFTRGPASGGFPVGPITGFDGRFINALRQRVEAVDFALDYRLDNVLGGTLTFAGLATRSISNRRELVPTIPGIESVGSSGFAKWLANGTVTFERGGWMLGWTTRYIGPYTILTSGALVPSQGAPGVSSQIYHDFLLRYRTGPTAPTLLRNVELQLNVVNLLNSEPPFFGFPPYYSTVGDPRRSIYYLSIRKSF